MPTTLETFEQLVRHRTAQELLPFLLALDKSEVVPVRQRTLSLEKELQNSSESAENPAEPQQTRSQLTMQRAYLLFLAGLATYSAKEARRLNPWYGRQLTLPEDWPARGEVPPFLAIIRQFRPAWLGEWLGRLTRESNWSVPQYSLLRALLANHLLEYDPWLVAQSLAHLPTHYNWRRNQGPNSDIPDFDKLILADLRTDEMLLRRDLPLLLDFDTMADSASTWSGKERTPVTWQTLLAVLLASGDLDRAEWLTHCLLALRRDFRRPLLTWIKNLYVSLKPTTEELLARQGELLELLSHPLPLVVNFALDQLKGIWTQPDFELATLLPPAEALLSRQDLKTGLRTLLIGLDRLLKADSAQAAPLARLYAGALAHADAGVQERAAKSLAALLGAKKPLLNAADAAEATATIAAYAELLGPPARTALAPWLAAPTEPAAPAPTERYKPLANFRPELSAATAMVPVADWHELLFLTGQVLKHDDPLALERWLEGLLRLQADLPADYASQLQPYLPQIITWGREPGQPLTVAQVREVTAQGHIVSGHAGLAEALILSWMLGFSEPLVPLVKPGYYAEPEPLVVAEQQRLAFAEALLLARRALPLLSTPSHAPHWLTPSALVPRLLAYQAAGQEPDPTDLAIALARLAVATTADAAAATAQLSQLHHAGLRALLAWMLAPTIAPLPASAIAAAEAPASASTATIGPLPLATALPWLWAVAARTRQPGGEFPGLAALTPPNCANVVRPYAMSWQIEAKSLTRKITWKPGVTEETEHWLELQMQPLLPAAAPPTPVALYSLYAAAPDSQRNRWHALSTLATTYDYLSTLLPHYPAPLHWRALTLASMHNAGESGPRDILTQVLRDWLAPGPALDEPATLLLAVGLTHRLAPVRALALETLLATIDHGRLVPGALAENLGRLLSAGFVPLPRLTTGLTQARAIGPRSDDALRQVLEALLPALPAAPLRQTNALLTLYADLPGRAGHPVPAPAQARLREWSASAPLKKLAAPLLT